MWRLLRIEFVILLDVIQVLDRLHARGLQPKVVQEQQIGAQDTGQETLVSTVAACGPAGEDIRRGVGSHLPSRPFAGYTLGASGSL